MWKFTITIIVFMAWQHCFAQDFNAYFHHLTVENGLSEATNNYVFKDSHGFVWISSTSGLNRFDGRQVRVYQPEPADSNAIYGQIMQSNFFEDENSDIWFSTYEGINRYIRKTDRFEHFTVKDKNNKPYTGYVVGGLDKNKCLWVFVNEQFVYLFDMKNNKFIKKHATTGSSQQFNIQKNADNQVIRSFANTWSLGNFGMQMTEYLPNDSIKQSLVFGKTSDNPLSIMNLFFENEDIWLGSHKGLHLFNPHTRAIKNYILNDYVSSILPINNYEFILPTNKNGLLMINKSNGSINRQLIHSQNNSHSLATDNTLFSHLDEDRNLWVCVYGNGIDFTNISKTKFNTIAHFPTSPKRTKPLVSYALTVDNEGSIWSGSLTQSINKFSKKGLLIDSFIDRTPSARGLKSNTATQSFTDKQGNIWFLNFTTLGYFDRFQQKFQYINTDNHFCLYGLATKSGKHLFATGNGISELIRTPQNGFKLQRIEQLPHEKPHTILFEDSDNWLWGSYDAVALRVYNASKNFELIKELPINGVITGFWHQPNTATVWVSSQNGLFKIDKNTWTYNSFTEKDGLPSRTVNTMQADAKGNLWLGTSKGLAKFDPSVKTTKSYNLTDGISDLNFNMYASTKAADGTMYFGTNNGITTFHPDKIIPLSIKARPTITEILVNDKIAKNLVCSTTKATNVSEIQSLELPYTNNTLSFNFSAMEYSDPMQCQYAYKMEGVDKDWVKAGTLPFARYANLPAGNYTFLIKASNSDGEWNDTPRTLHIRITPPFYKTWWFLTLVALATISLVAYIVYLRLSKVIALQKIRLNLYENLHDDIGSRLTAIVLSVDMLMQKSVIKDEKLGQIGTISRNSVANMRRLVWATAPENDALSTVAQQMQTDRQVLLPSGTAFNLTMDKSLENLNIGGDKRYQMLSIFNEALTNIAKYAHATTVETRIELKDQTLTMTITDNGKGFDPNAPREDSAMSSGHGLRNMQRRAERIKGHLAITSTLGKGTNVNLSFPMHDETMWTKFKDVLSKYHIKW
jgi:ligand-binding sensor domain-containing protein